MRATKQSVMVCGCLERERVVLESLPKICNRVDGGLDAWSSRWTARGCVAWKKLAILPSNGV